MATYELWQNGVLVEQIARPSRDEARRITQRRARELATSGDVEIRTPDGGVILLPCAK